MQNIDIELLPSNYTNVVTAKLWIKDGSRADPVKKKGAHQLLGSLLTRGCGPYNCTSIAELVEGCGAGLRCDINEDGLLITLKCSSQDFLNLIPTLGWMIYDPHIESDQLVLEQQLSIKAIQRQKENPFYLAFDGWRKIAYKNSPYGHDPLGCIKTLNSINRNDLIPIAKDLKRRQSILVLAGKVDKNIIDKIATLKPFDYLLNKNRTKEIKDNKSIYFPSIDYSFGDLFMEVQPTNQVVIMLGKPSIPHGDQEDLKLQLIDSYLSAGMSSLLFRKLREENGLAYEVGVHHPRREFNSPFILHASTTQEKSLLALKILIECWKELSDKELSDKELELARAKFKGQIAMSTQTSSQRAERLAQLKAFNLPINYDSKSTIEINNISSNDLLITSRKHLSKPFLSICGPDNAINKLSEYWEKQKIFL